MAAQFSVDPIPREISGQLHLIGVDANPSGPRRRVLRLSNEQVKALLRLKRIPEPENELDELKLLASATRTQRDQTKFGDTSRTHLFDATEAGIRAALGKPPNAKRGWHRDVLALIALASFAARAVLAETHRLAS